jgi:hypothetical protein
MKHNYFSKKILFHEKVWRITIVIYIYLQGFHVNQMTSNKSYYYMFIFFSFLVLCSTTDFAKKCGSKIEVVFYIYRLLIYNECLLRS